MFLPRQIPRRYCSLRYGKPFLHQGISDLAKTRVLPCLPLQVLGLFHLFSARSQSSEHPAATGWFLYQQSGSSSILSLAVLRLKIVKFCDEADVFIFLFFQFLPEFSSSGSSAESGLVRCVFSPEYRHQRWYHRLVCHQKACSFVPYILIMINWAAKNTIVKHSANWNMQSFWHKISRKQQGSQIVTTWNLRSRGWFHFVP